MKCSKLGSLWEIEENGQVKYTKDGISFYDSIELMEMESMQSLQQMIEEEQNRGI